MNPSFIAKILPAEGTVRKTPESNRKFYSKAECWKRELWNKSGLELHLFPCSVLHLKDVAQVMCSRHFQTLEKTCFTLALVSSCSSRYETAVNICCLFFPRSLLVELLNTYIQKCHVHQGTNQPEPTLVFLGRACIVSERLKSICQAIPLSESARFNSTGWPESRVIFSPSYFPSLPVSSFSRWGILMLPWFWKISWDLED